MNPHSNANQAEDDSEEMTSEDGYTPQANSVKMTVTLPRNVAAFLRWKAEVDGMKRDELLRKIIVRYAKKLREQDFRTPPVED